MDTYQSYIGGNFVFSLHSYESCKAHFCHYPQKDDSRKIDQYMELYGPPIALFPSSQTVNIIKERHGSNFSF